MAVPADMTITTMRGTFAVNKKLSDRLDHLFHLQSVPYIATKVSGIATVQLDVVVLPVDGGLQTRERDTSSPHRTIFQITMKQTFTAIGPLGLAPLKAIGLAPTRTETRVLDGGEFSDNEAAIGPIKGRWWLTTVDEILSDDSLDAFHKDASWSRCREVIRISVRSQRVDKDKVWSAEHMWSLEDYVGTRPSVHGAPDDLERTRSSSGEVGSRLHPLILGFLTKEG